MLVTWPPGQGFFPDLVFFVATLKGSAPLCERKTSTGHLLEIMARILQRIAVEAIRAGNTQRRTAIGQVVAWILRFGEELRPHIYPPRVATLDRLRRRARLRHKGDRPGKTQHRYEDGSSDTGAPFPVYAPRGALQELAVSICLAHGCNYVNVHTCREKIPILERSAPLDTYEQGRKNASPYNREEHPCTREKRHGRWR